MSDCGCSPARDFLTLPQAAAVLGQGGKRPSTCTLWRWCRKGCRGVHLEYQRFGREIRVTREALADFGRRLAESDGPLVCGHTVTSKPAPKPRSEARRAREVAAAEASLRAKGVLR
ncbi:MAG TPA: helix-turn-helix domain-containing protein [Candidatus Hydrogenedentes bacterium]|nr:helix-turn-helix domain-containing protein [Candidatus Hydrogenedentota bacterium]